MPLVSLSAPIGDIPMRGKLYAFRHGDFVIFLLVLILAATVAAPFIFVQSDTLYVEVRCNNELVKRLKLADGYHEVFTVQGENGVHNTIEINGKRVRIAESNCRDQVCVRTGWLTRAGQASVCLPSRVVVKLTGREEDNGVDAVVQ